MRRIASWLGGLLLSGLAFAPCASAATISFSCITGNSASDCAIGEQQISASLTDLGAGKVRFDFLNTGSDPSAITVIYFDNGTSPSLFGPATLIDADENGGHAGVDFTFGSGAPGNLPGGNPIAFTTSPGLIASADNPKPHRGINPGEWLGIVFALQAAVDFSDVLAQLASGQLRIGMHVQSFASGGSESFVNTPYAPVPLPAAGWLMLSALAPLWMLRRRGKAQLAA